VVKAEPREVASTARVAIVVEQDASAVIEEARKEEGGYMFNPEQLRSEAMGQLRQQLIESRSGVPVRDVEAADLVIRLQILDRNYTHATRWEWELTDKEGNVLAAKTGSSGFGVSGEALAAEVMRGIAEIDTMAYSSGGKAPVRVATKDRGPAGKFPSSKTDGSNSWAIVIGVEKYRENLPAAPGAEADARAFAAFAQQTLNVPEVNIRLLVGDRASKADINATLTEWLPRNAVEPGGRVYVFFSGHGAPDVELGTSFLVPYDGNPTFVRSTGLSVESLMQTLEGLKGQEVYVFLDACFSGQGERSVLPEGTRPLVPVRALASSPKVWSFSASGPRETTGAHATSGHGLFTHHLLDGLTGNADADGDGDVTMEELRVFVHDRVRVEARRQNREQTPVLSAPSGAPPIFVRGVARP
jgi:hypothetical protein